MSRASLDKEPHEVAAMFDEVAPRYDRMNTIMALGLDKRWRSATRKAIQSKHGERVLDLAAGTAVSTMEYARSGAWCLAADFSLGMLRSGARRPVPKVAADALALPFADDSFDVVTVSFGLRNFTDTAAAAREMLRVTKPGGRAVICEFSTPPNAAIRWAYFGVALRLIPVIARMASSNPAAYTYLPESIRAWPRQRELARIFAEAGWSELEWRNLTFGVVALHRAVKPNG